MIDPHNLDHRLEVFRVALTLAGVCALLSAILQFVSLSCFAVLLPPPRRLTLRLHYCVCLIISIIVQKTAQTIFTKFGGHGPRNKSAGLGGNPDRVSLELRLG